MLAFRIIFSIVFFLSLVEAARSYSEHDSQAIVESISAIPVSSEECEVLESMQRRGETLPRTVVQIRAVEKAFWRKCCSRILGQEPLMMIDGRPIHENILALIKDPALPIIESSIIDIHGVREILNDAWNQFYENCRLLFPAISSSSEEALPIPRFFSGSSFLALLLPEVVLEPSFVLLFSNDDFSALEASSFQDQPLAFIVNLSDADSPSSDVSEIASPSSDLEKCVEWFNKILRTKEGHTIQGMAMLAGRLLHISQYINAMRASNDPDNIAKAKRIITDHVIDNSNDCPDRALSGLDDIEWYRQLDSVASMEDALHLMLRLYKKQLICEELVAHEFSESAEEYIYLLLLLNKQFNLGVVEVDVRSSMAGARKTFEVAAGRLMEKINVEGFIHFVAKNHSFRRYLLTLSVYAIGLEAAASEPDAAEETIYNYIKEIISPVIRGMFTYEGSKFQQVSLLDMEALVALEA